MKIKILFYSICIAALFCSCNPNDYMNNLYVKPVAAFEIKKETYQVFESVHFVNKGSAQSYVVFPGDDGHVYGQMDNTGFPTASSGDFSYSYQEPGVYNAVWVATSINGDGDLESEVDSVKISVVATDGGLDKLVIYNIFKMPEYTGRVFYSSYGEFISADTLVCPILFASWRDATVNSIKAKQLVNFELASNLSKLYWVKPDDQEVEIVSSATTSKIVEFVQEGKLALQTFKVKTASGFVSPYYVAPVMIPQFTKFGLDGVNATITRDIAYYNIYDVEVKAASGTDLSKAKPTFEIMNGDSNLLDGTNCKVTVDGIEQISGVSILDLTGRTVTYRIDYNLMGSDNPKLTQHALMRVSVK